MCKQRSGIAAASLPAPPPNFISIASPGPGINTAAYFDYYYFLLLLLSVSDSQKALVWFFFFLRSKLFDFLKEETPKQKAFLNDGG